jgi:hypothetical protein
LTAVPDDSLGITKERLERDHVVYLHTETLPDGKPYTVEFHVDPADNYCDVYVIRDLDNYLVGGEPISIDDIEDWSLGEADEVDARLANEMAKRVIDIDRGAEVVPQAQASGENGQYEFDWAANASFHQWLGRVSTGIFSGIDREICRGLGRELAIPGSGGATAGLRRVVSGSDYSGIPPVVQSFLSRDLGAASEPVRGGLVAAGYRG